VAKSFFDFRKTLSEDIDYSLKDLVYYNEDALKESMDKVEQYDQKHFKDGWQSIELTPPPENDSQETKEELQHIIDEQTTRTKDDENSIYVSDFMESFHFREYLNENNLDYRSSEITAIIDDVWKITRTHKNKYNRPRPYQVAKALNMDFDTMYGTTMKTPAYPSGHSCGSRLVAEYLSMKHPAHRKQFIEIAERVGRGRIQAGFHYESDHEAGVELALKVLPYLQISKQDLLESIINLPRKDYSRTVFDNYDTEKPVLKPVVKKMIEDQIREFNKVAPVIKYRLIGSILTKRYRKDADLDINVLFDVADEDKEAMSEKLREIVREVNGKNVPGSVHPVNYFVIVDRSVYDKANKMADDVFDIVHDRFEKRTQSKPFDIEDYMKEFRARVEKIDIAKGEFKRDLVDYKELVELDDDDIENLRDRIQGKIKELEDDINTLIDMKDDALDKRKSGFEGEMSPEDIKKYGVRNRLPNNVIYKMLEKYYYFEFINKLKEIIGDDRKLSDKEADSLMSVGEALDRDSTIVFAFGRFNPPTIGHAKLMNTVKQVARKERANHQVFASASSDPRKNPLDQNSKIKFMKKMFKGSNIKPAGGNQRTFMEILKTYDKLYGNVIMIAGSDRINEFQKLADKYNGKDYNFKSVKIVSAGDRDPDAEGATGMSASKMRKAVAQGDMKSFEKGLPRGFRDEKGLFRDVAVGMRVDFKKALAASRDHYFGYQYKPVASLEDFDKKQLRDLYIREVIFNIGDKVHYVTEDVHGKIVRRSTNYIVLEDENDNLHKAWIYDCIPESADKEVAVREFNLDVDYGFEAVSEGDMKEKKKLAQDPDVRKEPGSQPKKYYKTLSKDVKQKRSDFFKKQDTSDTSPGSYKAAPGDDKAKTKTSKHTKKFRQMYGEIKEKEEFHLFDNKKDAEKKAKEIGGKVIDGTAYRAGHYAVYKGKAVKEAYEIGADYANHTKEITPGETPDEKPVDSKERTPENPQHKDVKKDKYTVKTFKEYAEDDKYSHLDEELEITEAEYQGKKVKLNDPVRGGSKKFYVYVKNNKGNVIKVSFGDTTGLSIKRDDPERRKNFRARHNCDTAKDKTTARYWSCRMWTARTKVSDLD